MAGYLRKAAGGETTRAQLASETRLLLGPDDDIAACIRGAIGHNRRTRRHLRQRRVAHRPCRQALGGIAPTRPVTTDQDRAAPARAADINARAAGHLDAIGGDGHPAAIAGAAARRHRTGDPCAAACTDGDAATRRTLR